MTTKNFGEVHKFGEEEIGKAEIIIFQSSKASINHTPTESRVSLERSPESSTNLVRKTLALNNSIIISSETNTSRDNFRKFTASITPETFTYNTDAESVSKAGSVTDVKPERTTIQENDEAKTTIIVTENDLTKSKESIDAISSETEQTTRVTPKELVLSTSSIMNEHLRTTMYTGSPEMQMHFTDKEIGDSLAPAYQTTIAEMITSPSIPESKSQWKKGEEEQLPLKNIATTVSEAELAFSVKHGTVTPTVIEVTRKEASIVIPESDSIGSIAVSERSDKLHGTTPKFGLEIAKVALMTEPQIGIEIVEASGKHASESSESIELNTTFYTYAKSIKPIQLTESTMKFESDSTKVSQKTDTPKSEFIQTSVPIKTIERKANTITLENFAGQPTKAIKSSEIPSTLEQTSGNTKSDDAISHGIVTVASSTNSSTLLSFNQQLSTMTSNAETVSFNKPINHDESSKMIAIQYSVTTTNATPTESATRTISLSASSANQAVATKLPMKFLSGNDTIEVMKTKSVANEDKSATTKTEHRRVSSGVEVEGSGEEITDFQNVGSIKGFVSSTISETSDLLGTNDEAHEIGLEIVLMKGYPKETKIVTQRNWTNVVTTSPDVILNASFSLVPSLIRELDRESASNSVGEKSTTGEFSTFDSHYKKKTTPFGAISSKDFEIEDVTGRKELDPTTNIYRSETASTLASGTTESILISKQSAFESMKTSPVAGETLLPIDLTRQRNMLKPTSSDEATVLQVYDRKLEPITMPQSKESLKVFSSSSNKKIAKASEMSKGPTNSTVKTIAKVKTITEEVGKGIMKAEERIKYSSYLTVVDLNTTSGSETTTLMPNVSRFEIKPVISNISKNGTVETQSAMNTSRSPSFRTTEVQGTARITEAFREYKKWTASDVAKITTTFNATSAAETDILTSSVTTVEEIKPSTVPETVRLETSLISESISAKDTGYGISRAAITPDVFSQSKSTATLTISVLSSKPVTTVEQKTYGLKHDETRVLKLETTAESAVLENGTETLETIKNESFSKFVVTESTLETASVSPVEKESVLIPEGTSSVLNTDIESPAFRTSTSPSSTSTEIVTKYGSAVTVTNPEGFPSLPFVSETKNLVSQVTSSTTTPAPQISETSFEDSAFRTISRAAENTVALQNFESSRIVSSTLTPSKSNLEIMSTTDSTNLLKMKSKTDGWTLKPEREKDETVLEVTTIVPSLISRLETTGSTINSIGIFTEVDQTTSKSSVSDESLFKITQQVRFRLFSYLCQFTYLFLLKSEFRT